MYSLSFRFLGSGLTVHFGLIFLVRRLIKYTGYGNAAGLLAHRGLMMNPLANPTSGAYSSDSEDSETEEYKQLESEYVTTPSLWFCSSFPILFRIPLECSDFLSSGGNISEFSGILFIILECLGVYSEFLLFFENSFFFENFIFDST